MARPLFAHPALTPMTTYYQTMPIGPTPPPNPSAGQLWWRSDPDGQLYIYYDDGTSQQWVAASTDRVV
jgi:hypothetical protein